MSGSMGESPEAGSRESETGNAKDSLQANAFRPHSCFQGKYFGTTDRSVLKKILAHREMRRGGKAHSDMNAGGRKGTPP